MIWIDFSQEQPVKIDRYFVVKDYFLTKRIDICVERWAETFVVTQQNHERTVKKVWKFTETGSEPYTVTHWMKIPHFPIDPIQDTPKGKVLMIGQ